MFEDALIPFATHKESGDIVSVDDVVSGEACGCFCPGCDAPLVARKGEVNKHHFTHAPRSINPDEPCPITFIRSILWMSNEILKGESQIELPSLTQMMNTTEGRVSVEITKAREFKYGWSSAKFVDDGAGLLITLVIQEAELGIYLCFDSKYRYFSEASQDAVVLIDLKSVGAELQAAKHGYTDILRHYLLSQNENRTWRSHPRYARIKGIHEEKIKCTEELRVREEAKVKATIVLGERQALARQAAERLKTQESEEQRCKAMIGIIRSIMNSGELTGRRCMRCHLMTARSEHVQECPHCQHFGFGDETLSEAYIKKAEKMYINFGFAADSIKYGKGNF